MFNRLTQALTTFTQINNRYSRLPDSKRSWLALPDISSVIESDDNFRIIVALVPEYSTSSPDALDSMDQDDVYDMFEEFYCRQPKNAKQLYQTPLMIKVFKQNLDTASESQENLDDYLTELQNELKNLKDQYCNLN